MIKKSDRTSWFDQFELALEPKKVEPVQNQSNQFRTGKIDETGQVFSSSVPNFKKNRSFLTP